MVRKMDTEQYTPAQNEIIAEIQRIAKMLGVDRLSQREFDKHHQVSALTTVGNTFGSWNRAVVAAGLDPYPPDGSERGPKISDEELLEEIVHLHQEIGKSPSERNINALGKYSIKPYRDRWGTLAKACEIAYSRFGHPDDS